MLTIGEEKEYKNELMPGSQMLNIPGKVTAEDIIYQPFPGYQNPDRWALISTYEEKKTGATFIKIHGLFNHQKMAENVGKAAMGQGYRSTCVVADVRGWLRFPMQGVESEVHVNEALKRIVNMEIKKDNNELDKLRSRVEASRKEIPTTAFGRYEQLVRQSARELLDALDKDDQKTIDLRKKFEDFRSKELAKIQHKPLDPILERHFKEKIKRASLQDRDMAKKLHGGGGNVPAIGMGLPSF